MALSGRKGHRPRRDRSGTTAAEARERALRIKHSFAAVAEAFIADKLAKERKARLAERDLRNIFMPAWAERPISEITSLDVLEIINTKKRTAPKMAGALLVLAQAVLQLGNRPANLRPDLFAMRPVEGEVGRRGDAVAGPATERQRDVRVLASQRRMGYPVGAVYRTVLTGLRLNEAAQISWPEVQGDIIIIPGVEDEGQRWQGGRASGADHRRRCGRSSHRCRASRTASSCSRSRAGASPMTMTAPMKADLDQRMLRTLKAMARRRGEDHHAVELPHGSTMTCAARSAPVWRHCASRTTSRKPCLAHRPAGIVGTYDIHQYADEKREALELWAQHIASLVNPEPAKVIKLPRRRR